MTVWICGTSVSIARDGYVSGLRDRLGQVPIENISVGDQTSITGLIRLTQVIDSVARGDILIWEYPLLDILLESMFGAEDILHAMQQAWLMAAERAAHVVVVKVIPRDQYAVPSDIERSIDRLVGQLGIPFFCTRQIAAELAICDPGAEYSDDRHPRADSRLLSALCDCLERLVLDLHGRPGKTLDIVLPTLWRWFGPEDLSTISATRVTRSNSFIEVQTLRLDPDVSCVQVPAHRRIIGIGIASTHQSGSLWCGHQCCAPASLQLPSELGFDFLVRATRYPCVRATVATLVAAPPHAFPRPGWADYGQVASQESRPVEILGLLLELSPSIGIDAIDAREALFAERKSKGLFSLGMTAAFRRRSKTDE